MQTLTKKYKIGVLCGDLRSVYLSLEFQSKGFEVYAYGLCEDEAVLINNICQDPLDIIDICNVLILPLPATRDNIYVHSKSSHIKLKLSEILSTTRNQKIIFGGILPGYFHNMCNQLGHSGFDYYTSEKLINKNALATAEGALMIAMSNTHTTIHGSDFGIIGYGRISTRLAEMLKALGGNVTVFARSQEALFDAQRNGYEVFKLAENKDDSYLFSFADKLNNCSVVFNTVPNVILSEDILSKLSLKQIYIELASSPGGIDLECARRLKLKNIYAPSLPGRYSPKSAGKYIFDEIIKVLYDLDGLESEVL